jgi:hypothetical protein
MRALVAFVSVLLLAAVIFAADVQPMNLKTGLWETTVTSQMSGMPPIPPEILSKMTPAQRDAMEKAAAGRGMGGPRTTTTRNCVTKESLAKALSFGENKDQNCTRTVVSSTSSRQELHLECTNGQIKTSGDVHFETSGQESVKGSATMSATGGPGAGRGMNMKMDFNSKWVSDDCGDLGKKQ